MVDPGNGQKPGKSVRIERSARRQPLHEWSIMTHRLARTARRAGQRARTRPTQEKIVVSVYPPFFDGACQVAPLGSAKVAPWHVALGLDHQARPEISSQSLPAPCLGGGVIEFVKSSRRRSTCWRRSARADRPTGSESRPSAAGIPGTPSFPARGYCPAGIDSNHSSVVGWKVFRGWS